MDLTRKQARVVLGFADNGMKVAKTARKMFFHENTIRYNLDNIRAATGLNPYGFYDLQKLVDMARAVLEEDTE